jgi:hypothetical protein
LDLKRYSRVVVREMGWGWWVEKAREFENTRRREGSIARTRENGEAKSRSRSMR